MSRSRGRPGKGPRQLHQAELLVREAAGEGGSTLLEPHSCQGVARCGEGRALGRGADMGADDDVVEDRHALKGPHDLEGAPHPEPADAVGLASDEGLACEDDLAALGLEEAVQEIEEGRLARAVGADDAEDGPFLDREADLIDRAQPAEGFREPAHLEEGLARGAERGAGVRRRSRQAAAGRVAGALSRARAAEPVAHAPVDALGGQQDDEDDGEAVDDPLDARESRRRAGPGASRSRG